MQHWITQPALAFIQRVLPGSPLCPPPVCHLLPRLEHGTLLVQAPGAGRQQGEHG